MFTLDISYNRLLEISITGYAIFVAVIVVLIDWSSGMQACDRANI